MNIRKLTRRTLIFCFPILLVTATVFAQHFKSIKSPEGIELQENGKKILFYQVRPKSVDGKYERAGYVHPLYSLHENSITEDMPEDHPYHRGIFWAWHQLIWNDSSVADGWVSEKISFNPTKVKVDNDRKKITIQSTLLWNTVSQNKKWMSIVKEKTRIRVYPSTDRYRIIDFDIQLFPLVDNLKIGGSNDPKGYGGFCLRLKLPADISFVSQGKTVTPEETPVIAGPWMDITGSFEGTSKQKSGVIVFANASGLNQQPWILRKVASMQNIPYPGRTPLLLSKKGLRLKYRVIVHEGEMSDIEINKLYKEYVDENN